MTTTSVLPGRARPRGKYPHFRRAGDFIFVSGTSSRRADDSIAGATVDAEGRAPLDIRAQTRAVIENSAGSWRARAHRSRIASRSRHFSST